MQPGGQQPGAPAPHSSLPAFNPNFFVQNPAAAFPYYHNFNLPYLQGSNNFLFLQNPNFAAAAAAAPRRDFSSGASGRRVGIDRVDAAVARARRELVAAGESVSAWKVSEAALLHLQAQSWTSLGIQMQDVPSLNQLVAIEGKINSFINCFVGVRRITSLYDLEVAICESEGVGRFDELELGPLVRHPLVVQYFSVRSDVTDIHKISTEEILVSLSKYMEAHWNQKIEVSEFMDFLAEKQSVTSREKLCIRIQNLGMHISVIREAMRAEKSAVKKTIKAMRQNLDNMKRKRPLFSSLKKELDERFNSLSQRVTSFSSLHENRHGKHIRFSSSSSEAEESDEMKSEDEGASKLFRHRVDACDRIGSCPYPSATEEKTRLGIKGEMDITLSSAGCKTESTVSGTAKKKRKLGTKSLDISNPSKFPKRDELCSSASEAIRESSSRNSLDAYDYAADHDSIGAFITTWKEACHNHTTSEVFDRMLRFYDVTSGQRRKIRQMFSSNPCAAVLHVAIASIKSGMWDSIYDACQSVDKFGFGNQILGSCSTYENIEVEPNVKEALTLTKSVTEQTTSPGVTVEDIIKKITTYAVPCNEEPTSGVSSLGIKIRILRNMSNFERWISEQFSVMEFKNLGHGEFSDFLERNVPLLPRELFKQLLSDDSEKPLLEISILKRHLDILLVQAFNSLWEDGTFTKQKIYELLTMQFPSIGLSIQQHGSSDLIIEKVREQRNSAISNCVIFSMTCLDKSSTKDAVNNHDKILDFINERTDLLQSSGVLGHKTSKDATETLLRAPMLFDLRAWLHWDVVFAPSLGPFVEWLLDGVHSEELWCLVTANGKVFRINHLATDSSFRDAARQGSAFRTALELVSLISLNGGKIRYFKHLLEDHARAAFDNLITSPRGAEHIDDDIARNLYGNTPQSFSRPCKAMVIASRFILDCLAFIPSEFRDFVTDVFLTGLSCFVKYAPSAILSECQKTHERVMLHEIGLSLGIVEWIEDHHQFSVNTEELSCVGSVSEPVNARSGKKFTPAVGTSEEIPCCEILETSNENGGARVEEFPDTSICTNVTCVSATDKPSEKSAELYSIGDAEMIIESIRREEFGLSSNSPDTENIMLSKQHERLGRALQCLAQELYSQDSHFLLELVQNADDNVYPKNVEPTLVFLLQETGIVVLNNEHGFSAQNIRALCDIANSTKKVSGAGYIGKKGIGFKSVFRVTDAPEIHSNNFHVKFDIREGQIGFVCPTVVPPCDIGLLSKLACDGTDNKDSNGWRTCIVLPFSSKLSGNAASITPMFSDLHPSLLLFLHRLRCIKLRNTLDNSLIVMKKEIIGNGIIKVSHGVEEMTWLVVSQQMQANALCGNSKPTEISIAFTLLESAKGFYSPCLNQQPVFAFLPLRTYGLKFIIQGDFVLPSSREGVDSDSLWNQWLLSEFPNLFVDAEKSFCEIPCYEDNPGKAVTVYMSFVPLIGEVHGFFSNLPRMIISKLRISNCLLKEGDKSTWVPPCKVLRNWSDRALNFLPDKLLHDHLGKAFLNRDISLSDSLAKALGVEEYGPSVLLRIVSSLCYSEGGLRSLGFEWLCSFLDELYDVMFHSHGSVAAGLDSEVINKLRKIPFIPLSDGTFSSVDEGAIWMHFDVSIVGHDGKSGPEDFPELYARLRTVSSSFLSVAHGNGSGTEIMLTEKICMLLRNFGVQQLSAHDILKVHILPAITDEKFANENMNLMTEYFSFVMAHLQSSCTACMVEKQHLVPDLCSKVLVLTNYGYKRPNEVSIHFSKEYGAPVDVKNLINTTDIEWCELDDSYLKHSITRSLPCGQNQWREFFSHLGITDFVTVTQVRKNLSDIPPYLLKTVMQDYELMRTELVAMDWESNELVQLLSLMSNSGSHDNCKYMLQILDTMWDKYYNDKVSGHWYFDSAEDMKPFTSSFMRSICNIPWVVSSVDDVLHYPGDLFHDCAAVRTILGAFAPYAIPKVNCEALQKALGLRTQVTMDDILEVFRMRRRSAGSFKASIQQMSRLYEFIWNETCSSKHKVLEELLSGPFIFVPEVCDFKHADLVSGTFFSAKEVYWHDFYGLKKLTESNCKENGGGFGGSPKVLCNIYPGLHDFFITDCRVNEVPPLHDYLEMLLQLTKSVLPSQAADTVFKVFSKWADEYESGVTSSKEIDHLKECLLKIEYKILPTEQDKWVSLHPSFGFLCWSDDMNLKKEFKHLDDIHFVYFGEVADDKKEVLKTKVGALLYTLGIPALSQVVTREAIFYGMKDSNIKASLVNWALPFAQRYMYNVLPEKYFQLKNSICESLRSLRVLVVEKLFYRNIVKKCAVASKSRFECGSLLQDTTLYTTESSDTHSLFMEFSRYLFKGSCELHLANFLHMITTMTESGSTEEQTEFFILNSQKLSKLPSDECIWSLESLPATDEIEDIMHASTSEMVNAEKALSKLEKRSGAVSCWPPADWKTAPGFKFARENGHRTQAASHPSHSSLDMQEDHPEYVSSSNPSCPLSASEVGAASTWISEDDGTLSALNFEALGVDPDFSFNQLQLNLPFDHSDSNSVPGGWGTSSTKFSFRNQLNTGNPNSAQALLTGRTGELVAYKYYLGKAGDGDAVNWVNKDNETGLPYDIVLRRKGDDNTMEYIEVKSTRSARKDWFMITTREWQYAIEKGDAFSIAHVVLHSDNTARVSTFKNPARLCQLGKLRLVVMMPKE
uniref:Protein NO VEIN C-terminal domain-containing protein n=1 Tax=Kalanchoe fedtschenkoi TaxID=63787 RepID=A0A7N0SZS8_KALFE